MRHDTEREGDTTMSINDTDNFSGRVNLAALYISQGRRSSRGFDNCFENNDGDAVATALYRRAQKAPDGDLARNLWRYLSKDTVEPVAIANAHRTNLSQWARELRDEAAKAWAETVRTWDQPPYYTELTPAGEQLVIPGCERNLAPAARQLDLF